MKKLRKFNLVAFLLAAGVFTVSCNKNVDGPGEQNEGEKTSFVVTIDPRGGSATRAPGVPDTEVGVGSENAVNDGWIVFAELESGYKAFFSTEVGGGGANGNGLDDQCLVDGAVVGSNVYVLINYDRANGSTTATTGGALPAGIFTDNNLSEATVLSLVEKQVKAKIHKLSDNFQTNTILGTQPNFTDLMLMTGVGRATAIPAGQTRATVTVGVYREYAKVNLAVSTVPGQKIVVNQNPGNPVTFHPAVIHSVNGYATRRVVHRIAPFMLPITTTLSTRDEWYVKRTPAFVKDATANNSAVIADLTTVSEFRYSYSLYLPATGPQLTRNGNFYVTPNYANSKKYGTAIIISATMTADFDGDGTISDGTNVEDPAAPGTFKPSEMNKARFFRAMITDATWPYNFSLYNTAKGTIYNITAQINSLGANTEDEALDQLTDLDVRVTIKDWSVRNINIDLE